MNLTQESTETPRQPVGQYKVSKGEQLFDWGVYGGIAGVGTFILTIPLAYLMKYKGGNNWLSNQITKIPGVKKGGTLDTAITTTALMHGGNVMTIPVYLAEQDREKIVDNLNKATGDTTPKEFIEPKPKQTIVSVLTSRLVAWGAVFAGLFSASKLFPNTMETFENEFGRGIAKLLGKGQYNVDVPKAMIGMEQQALADIAEMKLTSPLKGKELKEALKPLKENLNIIRESLTPHETRTFRLGKIGALDVFATIAAAILFFVGNNFFGRLFNEKKDDAPAQTETAPKKNLKIPNPTLPRTEEVPQLERSDKPAVQVSNVTERAPLAQAAHAIQH